MTSVALVKWTATGTNCVRETEGVSDETGMARYSFRRIELDGSVEILRN